MLKQLLLAGALALPQALWAQAGFEPGSYVLAASPGSTQRGAVRLKGNTLQVRDAAGKKVSLPAQELLYCRVGGVKYVAFSTLSLPNTLVESDLHNLLLPQLDSGQVLLFALSQQINVVLSTGLPVSTSTEMFALQRHDDSRPTVVKGRGQQFRDAVRPFLAARPDLLRLLDEKRIAMSNLPEALRALNHNTPFTPPSALNLE